MPGQTLKIPLFLYEEGVSSRISILVPNILQFMTKNVLSTIKEGGKANLFL